MFALLLSGWLAAADGETPPVDPRTEAIVVKAAEVHTGDGQVFRPGAVVLMDGEIAAVGSDAGLPLSPKVIDLGDVVLTPGLVDAACQLGPSTVVGFAEQVSEVIPHMSVEDAIDLDSRSLKTLASEGVTTIYVTPEAASVIGSRGAVIKTGGAGHSRFVEAPPAIKVTVGPESMSRGGRNGTPRGTNITFMVRRPTTRMGSVFVFRQAFYDAIRQQSGLPVSHQDPEAMAALGDVLEGRVALRFQARKAHDIYTAERITSEFGIEHVLEAGHEAYRCLDLLTTNNTPVIYGPFGTPGAQAFGDRTQACHTAATKLRDAGVTFCLTAADLTGDRGLARQAGMALRHGLTTEEALKAVTTTPAELLGISDRVGSLAKGKQADLVAWTGAPCSDASRVIFTMVDGRVTFDPRGLADSEAP